MSIRFFLGAAAAMAVTSCAGLTAKPDPNVQRAVYTAESDFAAALPIAVAYEQLPACVDGGVRPCANAALVTRITAAARAARASLQTAEAAARSGSNAAALTTLALQARADVAAFAAIVGVLPVQVKP